MCNGFGDPASGFFVSTVLGSFLVCLLWSSRDLRGRWQEYRSDRLALAPDPFLEEAPHIVAPSAAPPSGTAKEESPSPGDEAPAAKKKASRKKSTKKTTSRKSAKKPPEDPKEEN